MSNISFCPCAVPMSVEDDCERMKLDVDEEIVVDSGTRDYNALYNKPKINDIELIGNLNLSDVGVALKTDIPERVSQLENDSGYITDGGVHPVDKDDEMTQPVGIDSDGRLWTTPVNSGRDKHYVYEQSDASRTWVITHDLNKFPSVTIVDSAGNVVVGDIQYIGQDMVVCNFTSPFSGRAYLN